MARSKDTRRRLNPAEVHRLWSAIIKCQERSPTEPVLIDKLRPHFDNDEQLLQTLTKAIDEKLIQANTDNLKLPNGEQPEIPCEVSLPVKNDSKPKHDWYCFHCHQITSPDSEAMMESLSDSENGEPEIEELNKCHQCSRSFHNSCSKRQYTYIVRLEADKRSNFDDEFDVSRNSQLCLLCLLKKEHPTPFSINDNHFSAGELNEILSYTFCPFIEDRPKKKNDLIKQIIHSFSERAKEEIVATDGVDAACTKLALRHLVHDFIDIHTVQQKLADKKYHSIGEYFDDCLKLGHVFEIVFIASGQSKIGRIKDFKSDLVDIFDEMRIDFKDIFSCINCFLLMNRDSDDAFWFSQICDPPHGLVFAKLKGYSYWPAKVIQPRILGDIKDVKRFEVRFFGDNHDRFVVDQAFVKDIDSPLSELGITVKTNSQIQKAFEELRHHRELLGAKERKNSNPRGNRLTRKSIDTRNEKIVQESNDKEDVKPKTIKANRRNSNRNSVAEKKAVEEKVVEEVDEESQDSAKKNAEVANGNGNVFSTESKVTQVEVPIRLKRERKSARSLDGYETDFSVKRKRKIDTSGTETDSISGDESLSAKRSRRSVDNDLRKKIIKKNNKNKMEDLVEEDKYDDKQNGNDEDTVNNDSDHEQEESGKSEKLEHEDEQFEDEEDGDAEDEEEETEEEAKPAKKYVKKTAKSTRRRSTRNESKKRGRPSKNSTVEIQVQNGHMSAEDVEISDDDDDDEVEDDNEVFEPNQKFTKIRKNPRRSRSESVTSPLLTNYQRRSRKQTEYFSPSKKPTIDLTQPRKRGRPSKAYLEQLENEKSLIEKERQAILQHRKSKVTVKAFVPTVTAKKTAIGVTNPLSSLMSPLLFKLPEDFVFPDQFPDAYQNGNDSEEEEYPFDDEQLEQDIRDYEESREREKRLKTLLYRQQYQYQKYRSQQLIVPQQRQHFPFSNPTTPPSSMNGMPPTTIPRPDNVGLHISEISETYIDFSNDSIYVPNNKTKRLLNYYIHDSKTNPEKGISRGDYLANFYHRRDSLTDEMLEEHEYLDNNGPKKRGRPPKPGGEAEEIAKAKTCLEKSYLQDTACNRECLQKNAKSFKKFRLFVAMQTKDEIEKMRQQIGELTERNVTLERENAELKTTAVRQGQIVQQYNPDVLNILHDKINETKRNIWCSNCLSHRGIYHCCFNIHYCSTACQADHWPKHFKNCLQRRGVTPYSRDDMIDKSVATSLSLPISSASISTNSSISGESSNSNITSFIAALTGEPLLPAKSPTKFRPKKGKSPTKGSSKKTETRGRKKKILLNSPRKKAKKDLKAIKKVGKTAMKAKSKKAKEEVRVKRKYVRKNQKESPKKTKMEKKEKVVKKERKSRKKKDEKEEEPEELIELSDDDDVPDEIEEHPFTTRIIVLDKEDVENDAGSDNGDEEEEPENDEEENDMEENGYVAESDEEAKSDKDDDEDNDGEAQEDEEDNESENGSQDEEKTNTLTTLELKSSEFETADTITNSFGD